MPTKRSTPNVFMQQSAGQLATAAMKTCREIEHAKGMTREERVQLGQRTRYLLIAMAWRFMRDGRSATGEMNAERDPSTFVECYLRIAHEECRAGRRVALERAADLVQRLTGARLPQGLVDQGAQSDEALQHSLQAMQRAVLESAPPSGR